MSVFFGIDTARDVRTVAEAVHGLAGSLPSWVGRYLADYPISADEAAWLHANNIRILPIWNGAGPATVAGAAAVGQQQAAAAVIAARALHIPAGVAIPIDIEARWEPTADFLAGWLAGIHAGGYVGAAYLNVTEDSHAQPWIQARGMSAAPGVIYSSEPEPYSLQDTVATEWYDFTQTPLGVHGDDVRWWQYWEKSLGNTVDLDLATQQGYDLLWAPATPAPAVAQFRVVTGGALKVEPNHLCRPAIDPRHDPVTLHPGDTVIATGRTTSNWTEVHLTGALAMVHGWYVSDALRAL